MKITGKKLLCSQIEIRYVSKCDVCNKIINIEKYFELFNENLIFVSPKSDFGSSSLNFFIFRFQLFPNSFALSFKNRILIGTNLVALLKTLNFPFLIIFTKELLGINSKIIWYVKSN